MLLSILSILGGISANQHVLDSGYARAQIAFGESSANQAVQEALDQALDKDPAKFYAALDPFNGPGGRPAKSIPRADWQWHIQSEKFPNHEVRARNPKKLGIDDAVKQISGYIDVLDEDKHFFFWLFESRNDPKNDPVVLWLNGGPGCSSSTGQFFELGPASLDDDLNPVLNPYSWNNNATVIFLDEPVNVGYSYSSQRVKNSRAAGDDVYAFLSLLFENFPEYNTGDFHIAGESYGGHYLPAIGKSIITHGDRNFNLTSLLIGNGITDPFNQVEASIDMACGEGGYPAVYSSQECSAAYAKLPRCQFLIQQCYDTLSDLTCAAAGLYCGSEVESQYSKTGRNPYDIRDLCYDDCYPQIKNVDKYLNQTHVKEAVGAEPVDFVGCKSSVGVDFALTGDGSKPFHYDVRDILEYGVPVLIYAGDKDWICNWLGNRKWTNKLEWSHHTEFADTPHWYWHVDGELAGHVKNVENLTFLRVLDAGHMVPFNKPAQALEMLNRWVSGDLSFKN